VAAVLGTLVLNETFSIAMGIGFALVILGSTLATRRSPTVRGQGVTAAEAALFPTAPDS
jgi:drug/metabolite transporter (DMT)-like permease